MTARTPFRLITKPVSAWNKPLNADFRELFKSLSRAAIHGVTAKWDELASDAVDALSAVGLDNDPGQLAWVLIRRALTRSIYELVSDSARLIPENTKADPDTICDALDLSLEQAELTLDRNLFDRPADLQIIDDMKIPFKQWLVGNTLTDAQASGITGRLNTYFVYALNHEWLENGRLYAPLKEAIDTPFTQAGEKEQAWSKYIAWLQRQVNEGMLDETFGLTQVYVPLRAYYREPIKDKSDIEIERAIGRGEDEKKIVVDLENNLLEWLNSRDRADAVRVISGGPGSGKSSFVKIFAAHVAEKRLTKVLFIPLHQFRPMDDMTEAVGDFVRSTNILAVNPLDPKKGEKQLLIIFDGLDELAKQGKVANEIAQQFVSEVQRTLDRRNSAELRIQVLISGRELAIQSNASHFRKSHQVLHVLPYYINKDQREQFEDHKKLLTIDQRDVWWKKYGKASGKDFNSMPNELHHDDLDEITTQPLLNYLVALTHARNKIDFSGEVNLNVIYDDLLHAVYDRAYAGHPHKAIEGMKYSSFARILEEIALAAWHGDGRTTTVREIEDHCQGSGLSKWLDDFQEGAKTGVTRLLAAFYFRQHGQRQSGDKTFEFTHKSFGEYLTAKRIVHTLRRIDKELKRRETNPEDGWDYRQALQHWVEICGPTAMDTYLVQFLRNEVSLLKVAEVERWQHFLCELINFMLKHGMPMELFANRTSYQTESRQSRNAEEALLVALSDCARMTKRVSQVRWPESTSAGEWIKRLQGQRAGGDNKLVMSSFAYLNLEHQILYILDLFRADLSFVNAPNILASWVCLYNANLSGANLRAADLGGANLGVVNLRGAKLERARLNEAKLGEADLREADLRGADLRDADLRGADLREADLRGADLREADLRGADLRDADLRDANLEGANLEGAKLKGTILKEAQNKRSLSSYTSGNKKPRGSKKHSRSR